MTQCKQANTGSSSNEGSPVQEQTIQDVVKKLIEKHGEAARFRAERGAKQVAVLWRASDGSVTDYEQFCLDQFVSNDGDLEVLFNKLSYGFEVLNGYFMLINKDLMRPLHLDMGPVTPIDELFGSFSAGAHLTEDLLNNKIAFITALNFPQYTLAEKTAMGEKWGRKEWAYAHGRPVHLAHPRPVFAGLLHG
jgi:hypothetical protein